MTFPPRPRLPGSTSLALAASALILGLAGCDGRAGEPVTALAPGAAASGSSGVDGPEVRIEEPEDGATVSGTVAIEVRARGKDFDLERADLFIAGELVTSETAEEFTYSWSTAGLSGNQTITAEAIDVEGNSASTSVSVTVESTDAGGGDEPGDSDGPGVLSVAVNPNMVTGGDASRGTVGLTAAAPSGGTSVALSSSSTDVATVPASVTVAAGETTATFTVSTSAVTVSTDVTISASAGGSSDTAILTVAPGSGGGTLASLAIDPDQVVGGETATGTATFEAAADTETTVTLTSSDESVATAPESVPVPAGATTATFAVTTLPNTTGVGQFAVISGHAGGVTRSASITTVGEPSGPAVAALDLFPSSLGGGGPVTGIVTFEAPLNDGVILSFTSSHPDIVAVPEGETPQRFWSDRQRAFPITTNAVGADVDVTITARACCGAVGEATATLTVTTDAPPPADVVEVDKARWTPGGRGGTLEVRASSTSETALLSVFIAGTDRHLVDLRPVGRGRYEGEQSFGGGMTNPGAIDVRSNLGGSDTAEVRD